MSKFIKIIAALILLASCSESKMLENSLSNYDASIDYLHDSKINNCIKKDTIFINSLSKLNLDTFTSVSKINKIFLPFIIYNYDKINMRVKLGQSSIEQPYSTFFVNSLISESNRSACFVTKKDKPDINQYSLEISIDSCKTVSVYQRRTIVIYYFVGYIKGFQELGFPAKTNLNVNIILRKHDKIVITKNYNIDWVQPFEFGWSRDIEKARSNFTTNMAESLSLSTKKCIENIIKDLNEYLNGSK